MLFPGMSSTCIGTDHKNAVPFPNKKHEKLFHANGRMTGDTNMSA
jgi:hypothetical protein